MRCERRTTTRRKLILTTEEKVREKKKKKGGREGIRRERGRTILNASDLRHKGALGCRKKVYKEIFKRSLDLLYTILRSVISYCISFWGVN